MSVWGEEQTPNNEREQARTQKSAMRVWGFRGKAPAAGGTWIMGRSPERSKILHLQK